MVEIGVVPYESLQLGAKVVSLLGRPGHIIDLLPDDDDSIVFEWEGDEDPKVSVAYHQDCKVLYTGEVT